MKYKYKDKIFDYREDAEDEVYNNRNISVEYDEFLDEVYGDIKICGLTYKASYVFYKVDPIAYNVSYDDFIDSIISEAIEVIDDEEA